MKKPKPHRIAKAGSARHLRAILKAFDELIECVEDGELEYLAWCLDKPLPDNLARDLPPALRNAREHFKKKLQLHAIDKKPASPGG